MRDQLSRRVTIALVAIGGTVAFATAFAGSLLLAGLVGLSSVAAAVLLAWRRAVPPVDPGRRRFLATAAGFGVAVVGGGAGLGRTLRRLTTPDPRPVLEGMARKLGSEYLELVRRAYHPERSGDLQLLVSPYSSANYEPESRSLVPNDPRSSHAAPWMYLERVPISIYAPGIVGPSTSTDRVTLADLAPTTALLMGFEGFLAPDGTPLPAIGRPAKAPKVIVTFVIDGGGWNVLREHPDAWPNWKRLMRDGATYRNAIIGSFPAVTASAHANIGTGAFPRTHGITGHNVRYEGKPRKAYGTPGQADPSFILVPTLAEAWSEETGDGAWVGEIGYQVWHLGMIGRGGNRPLGDLPVGVFWDERGDGGWKPHNPDLFRLPREVPGLDRFEERRASYTSPFPPTPFDPQGRAEPCCSPPVIQYQGDLTEAAFESEPIGADDVTDLLYVNYKAPDYAGHVWNMHDDREAEALSAVDAELGRLADTLASRFSPGEYVLIVTADHGQCPPIDRSGGVRVDPVQLDADIDREFGRGLISVVESVVPSEIYLSSAGLADAGVTTEDIAAFLAGYRYRDNIGPYVPEAAIRRDRLGHPEFAAVLPTSFIADLAARDLSSYGDVEWPNTDPFGVPEVSW